LSSEQKSLQDVEKKSNLELRDATLDIVDSEHKTAPEQEEGYSYIKTSDLENGRINFDDVTRISEEDYEEWTRRLKPDPGDIILTREAPVGRLGIIPENKNVALGQRTVLIRPNPDILDEKYLLYLLLSRDIQKKI